MSSEPSQTKSDSFQYLNLLRILAILFVILLHCLTPYINSVGLFNTKTWWFSNIANAFVRSGVPLFFMISGYLLLSSKSTLHISRFYQKRFSRVLVPFLIWHAIYFLYYAVTNRTDISVSAFFQSLFVRGSAYHFWFVYTLMGIYLLLPYLKRIVDHCTMKQLWGLLCIISFTGTIRPFLNTVTPFYMFLFEPLMEGYIAFFLLGYLLGKVDMTRKIRFLIYALASVGASITIIGNYLYSSHEEINLYFNGGYQLGHFLCATGIFVFAKYSREIKISFLQSAIATLSSVTYTMYLCHVLILDISEKYIIRLVSPALTIIANFVVVVCVSTAIGLLLHCLSMLLRTLHTSHSRDKSFTA